MKLKFFCRCSFVSFLVGLRNYQHSCMCVAFFSGRYEEQYSSSASQQSLQLIHIRQCPLFSTLRFPCSRFSLICRNTRRRVLTTCYFLGLVCTLMVMKMEKSLYCTLKKFLFATFYKRRVKNMKLTVDFRNVSKNFNAEILSNLYSVRNVFKKSPSEFKFEYLLAEKR